MEKNSMDPAAPNETIGERLRRVRIERGLTQRALACDGVSHAHISRIEAGTREASVKALRLLAARLGVSADYLERGIDQADRGAIQHALSDAELALRLGTDPAVGARLDDLRAQAVRLGDDDLAQRAAVLAGLAAARDGKPGTAIGLLEEAVSAEGADPVDEPDVFVTLGTAYLGIGRSADAIALYERCVGAAAAQIEEAKAARVRYATHLSYALVDAGQFERARALLDTVAAEPPADPYSRVRLAWAQARLEATVGNLATARAHLDRAIALLETTEDDLQRSRAEVVYAEILVWDGDDESAATHVERAAGIVRSADANEVGAFRALQGLLAIRAGESAAAEAHVLAALQLIGDSDFGRSVACLALGLIHLDADALADAMHAYGEGLSSFERTSSWALGAAYCRMWAEALDDHGHRQAATTARSDAARLGHRVPVSVAVGA
jgi:transcriptional regulator with XRE-family HTH domain